MALIGGTGLRIEIDAANVLYATNCTLNITKGLNEVLHKDTANNGEFAEYTADGATGATLTHSGFLGSDSAVIAFFAALTAGTSIAWKFKSADLTIAEWVGTGFFNSNDIEAAVGTTATLGLGIQVSGSFTCATPV